VPAPTSARPRTPKRRRTPRRPLLPVLAGLDIAMLTTARLNGAAVDTRLIDAVTQIELDLSVEGANQLTVHVEDPTNELLRSPLLSGPVDLALPDAGRWRLHRGAGAGGITIGGTSTQLRMWDLGAAALAGDTGALRKDGSRMNLGAFTRLLARRVRDQITLTAVVPAPGDRPFQDEAADPEPEDSDDRPLGINATRTGQVTIKGAQADPDQLRNIDTCLRVAIEENAPALAALAGVLAGIEESLFRNLPGGDRDSRGVLQVRDSTMQSLRAQGVRINNRNVEQCFREFFRGGYWRYRPKGAVELARENPSWTAGQIAQACQGSAPARYDTHDAEGRKIIEAWSGKPLAQWRQVVRAGGNGEDPASGERNPAEWTRGGAESSWAALGRLAEPLGRRVFTTNVTTRHPRLVIAQDRQLILSAPHLTVELDDETLLAERPAITLEGIERAQQIELAVFANAWPAPPGAVADIGNAGVELDGPWIVQNLRLTAGDPIARVILAQPTTKRADPPRSRGTSKDGADGATRTSEERTGAKKTIAWAASKIGARETGYNTGPDVDPLIRRGGGTPGQAWCGFFCGAALKAAGIDAPASIGAVEWSYNSAPRKLSPFRGAVAAKDAEPGDLVILFGSTTHIGLVERNDRRNSRLHTIEGNTGLPNGGQGVARKERPYSDCVRIAQVDYGDDS